MKTAQDYLAEANKVVPRLSVQDGIARHKEGRTVFVDVRDSAAIAASGTIAGALRIPRGFIEFAATEGGTFYNERLKKDAPIVLICGAGGQAALTGKTLIEMGYQNVSNVGGFKDWAESGGPTEDG